MLCSKFAHCLWLTFRCSDQSKSQLTSTMLFWTIHLVRWSSQSFGRTASPAYRRALSVPRRCRGRVWPQATYLQRQRRFVSVGHRGRHRTGTGHPCHSQIPRPDRRLGGRRRSQSRTTYWSRSLLGLRCPCRRAVQPDFSAEPSSRWLRSDGRIEPHRHPG